jgi:predicted 3-demethylubiquinone-9 3-methyltransferase (glyoxalase superfamily)
VDHTGGGAEEAARFYAGIFPDSSVDAVHRAPGDYPDGKQGDVLTVEFSLMGIPCLGLNGGPMFKQTEAFSFQVATEDQAETDPAAAKRAFDAMMTMQKIDIARIEAARQG